ncbi:MAG: peroxiredoxin [Chloroflexota bacterium]
MLEIGQLAPAITATDHTGKAFDLAEMRGKKVWLYFYTSPGGKNCTAHACGYRDNLARFTAKGIEIVGLNDRPAAEQREWVEREGLPFRVLSDPDRAIARAYGIWEEGAERYVANNGGGRRPAVLVDEQGKVAMVLPDLMTVEDDLAALGAV